MDKETGEQAAIIITNSPPATIKFTTSPSEPSSSQGHKETELESQTVQTEKEKTIFYRYGEIKLRNEILKSNTYNQFWKKTSSSQSRLFSVFDIEHGKMHMAFLKAQIPQRKSAANYKSTTFEFITKDMHPIDQLEMHKKTGEMISSTLTKTAMSLSKLQVSFANVQSQLKMEKVSSLAKDNRIKSLEDLVIKIGYEPKDVNVAKEIVKKKNLDITELWKQLQLLAT